MAANPIPEAVRALVEAAEALGHHSALRSSGDDTIAYWAERVASLSQALTAAQQQGQAVACGCGLDTCVESWEPGCGLGNSVEHAAADNALHSPSAPVGVEGIIAADEAAWALAARAEAAGAERDESDNDMWWTLRIDQFKALAQQPAAGAAGLLDAMRQVLIRAVEHPDDDDADRKRNLYHIAHIAKSAIAKATQHQEPKPSESPEDSGLSGYDLIGGDA